MRRALLTALVTCLTAIGCSRNDTISPASLAAPSQQASTLRSSSPRLPLLQTAADHPIRIVQGEFTFPDNHHGTASLQGTEGFRFGPTIGDGQFPGSQCIVSIDCRPGAVVTLHGEWAGLDLAGAVVWRGKTYPNVGVNSGALLRLDGQFVSPPQGAAATTIKVPFVLGGFVQPEELGDILTVEGVGTATLNMVWDTTLGENGTWAIVSSRYEFRGSRPSPVLD